METIQQLKDKIKLLEKAFEQEQIGREKAQEESRNVKLRMLEDELKFLKGLEFDIIPGDTIIEVIKIKDRIEQIQRQISDLQNGKTKTD